MDRQLTGGRASGHSASERLTVGPLCSRVDRCKLDSAFDPHRRETGCC